jgi:coatomer protein complex subunit gamma
MNFLSNVLREDGGFEYKKVIVDSILILIKEIPEAKEPGLGHLCEFIEVNACLTCTKDSAI